MLELLNEPGWLRHIGDRGVRTVEAARDYVTGRFLAMFREHGYGSYVVTLKQTAEPIGLCGLVRRDGLDGPDLGFAFLDRFHGRGYAREAAIAVLDEARRVHGVTRLLAIASPANERSIALLQKLGFRSEGTVRLPGEETDIGFFAVELDQTVASK